MKKDRMKFTPKRIRFIGFVSCLSFGIAFLYLAILSYNRYSEVYRQIKEEEAKVVDLEKDIRNLSKLISDYQKEKEEFEGLLFSDRDIATFLEEFGEFANKAKLRIVDMRVQEFQRVKEVEDIIAQKPGAVSIRRANQKKEEDYSLLSMPIKVTAEGNFEYIVDFLISLERYRQILTISDVHIRTKTYPMLSCSFLLRLYSLKKLQEQERQ